MGTHGIDMNNVNVHTHTHTLITQTMHTQSVLYIVIIARALNAFELIEMTIFTDD